MLGHVFSGDAFLALSSNEDLDYLIPEPGATRWTDNMAIPKGAEHPDNAHKFINYILGAKTGAALSNYTYYGSPNEAALTDDRRRPQEASWLPLGAERLRTAADDTGRGEGDSRVLDLFTAVKSS